jgi:oligosaccharide repeat unit polymerase
MKKIILILFFSFLNIGLFLIDDFRLLGSIYFYCCVFFLVYEILILKKIEIIHIWIGAFLFIILSEVFNYTQVQIRSNFIDVLRYLILSNNLVILGYYLRSKKHAASLNVNGNQSVEYFSPSRFTPLVFFILTILYVGFRIQNALLTFSLGRNVIGTDSNESFILGSIINALGYVLPAVIAYYYVIQKSIPIYRAFLYSSPIFIILFMNGTRFPLLFAVLGFVLVVMSKFKHGKKSKTKPLLLLVCSVVSLFFLTSIMKHLRSSTTHDNEITFFDSYSTYDGFPAYASSLMSPEGVIDMTSLMFNYFETNDHKYGESSSFILYFWVPRTVWEEKPTMLGYWLIRKFRSNFSDGHSTSFGFTGDFYADFGVYSVIPIFCTGFFLGWAEEYRVNAMKSNGFKIVIGAMMLPYFFFFVRSPITSTMNFIAICIFYYMFKKLFFSN